MSSRFWSRQGGLRFVDFIPCLSSGVSAAKALFHKSRPQHTCCKHKQVISIFLQLHTARKNKLISRGFSRFMTPPTGRVMRFSITRRSSRIGSDGVRNLTVRVGSSRIGSAGVRNLTVRVGSGRVGSGQMVLKISRFGSGRAGSG